MTTAYESRVQEAVRVLGGERLTVAQVGQRLGGECSYQTAYQALEQARYRKLADRSKVGGETANHYFAIDPPPPPPPSAEEVLANLRDANAKFPTEVRRKIRARLREQEESGERASIRLVGNYMGIPLWADGFPPVEVHNVEVGRRFAVRGRACPQCGERKGHADGCLGIHPAYLEEGDVVYVRDDLHDTAQQAGADVCEIWERESAEISRTRMEQTDDPAVYVEKERTSTDDGMGVSYWKVEFN